MRWLREPLLHFFLVGAALFWITARVSGPALERPDRIVLTQGDLEQLGQGFARTWQRPPSAQELAGLVEERVREEVLYREALAMGLDRDDTIVRRRLRQKLEFLSEDLAVAEPTEAELADWLAAHPESFRVEPRLGFRQVYLSRDRRGERLAADARSLLARLRGGDGNGDPAALGAPLPLPAEAASLSAGEIARLFGEGFAARLVELEPGRWEGPVESAYGLHLVLVKERVPGRMPALEEVRDAVARDWLAQRRSDPREEFYRALRERYEIEVPDLAAGGPPAPGAQAQAPPPPGPGEVD